MLWTLGHEISFILKTKGHHDNILLSMILPRACHGPPTPAAAPHETPDHAAAPHDSTQNQETWSVYPAPSITMVCAALCFHIVTLEIRSSDNTASITCTVAVMI